MESRLMGAVCVFAASLTSVSASAVGVDGQGTWQSTLEGRDLDGNATTYEAYYDTTLDITWLADANYAQTSGYDADGRMNWDDANTWATNLNVDGITGWRLPTLSPLNGTSFSTTLSTDGSTDSGMATTTTDRTDGGWRDSSGAPVSEMGHMSYVTLANLGQCDPNLPWCTEQTGWGLSNTGPFANIQTDHYWSDLEFESSLAWGFTFYTGLMVTDPKTPGYYAWAVADGDIGAVPIPPALYLFGTGLIGLIGMARSKQSNRAVI